MIVLRATRAAPAVWFAYSPDRKGEHPAQHLEKFRGTLQADAYAGFNQLYARWSHPTSGVLGARATPLLRSGASAQFAGSARGAAADRRAVWNRRTDSRPPAGRAPSRPPGPGQTTAGFSAPVVRGDLVEALAQVGDDGGDPLRAFALGRIDALYRRWTHRDRQQRRRTLFARRSSGPEELPVCWIGCWWQNVRRPSTA